MEDVIELFFRQENVTRDVVFDEREILVAGEVLDVFEVAGDEVIAIAMTRCPSARSRSVRCDTRKPAPPVTTEPVANSKPGRVFSGCDWNCERKTGRPD